MLSNTLGRNSFYVMTSYCFPVLFLPVVKLKDQWVIASNLNTHFWGEDREEGKEKKKEEKGHPLFPLKAQESFTVSMGQF